MFHSPWDLEAIWLSYNKLLHNLFFINNAFVNSIRWERKDQLLTRARALRDSDDRRSPDIWITWWGNCSNRILRNNILDINLLQSFFSCITYAFKEEIVLNMAFWIVMLCNLEWAKRFGGTYHLCLQGQLQVQLACLPSSFPYSWTLTI